MEGSSDSNVNNNFVMGNLGSITSIGILLKGTSNTTVKQNSVGQFNQAFYIDDSPMIKSTKTGLLKIKLCIVQEV